MRRFVFAWTILVTSFAFGQTPTPTPSATPVPMLRLSLPIITSVPCSGSGKEEAITIEPGPALNKFTVRFSGCQCIVDTATVVPASVANGGGGSLALICGVNNTPPTPAASPTPTPNPTPTPTPSPTPIPSPTPVPTPTTGAVTHVQSCAATHSTSSVASVTCQNVGASTIAVGVSSTVVVGAVTSGCLITAVSDGTNAYHKTLSSPASQSGVGNAYVMYFKYTTAPGTVKISATGVSGCTVDMWADEFRNAADIDQDAIGVSGSGTAINTPLITPSQGAGVFAACIAGGNVQAGSGSPWTQDTVVNGNNAEWLANASGSPLAVKMTEAGGSGWACAAASFR